MERIDNLTEIVRREVADYHGPALKATTYYFEDRTNQIYTVIMVPEYEYPRTEKSAVTILARIVDDTVIVEEDITDRPLFEELMRAGIPRDKIVLAYAGEQAPTQA